MDNGASSYHRFLEGDREGITELVDVYYDGLVLFLNTWLNNLHDAEDMAEETLVVLTTRKPEFTGQFLRKNRRTVTVPPEDMTKLAESEQDAARDFFADEEKQALHRCLVRLRPEYRRILWLRYFESMSAKEAAGVMGKSVHSVNHLTERARDALRAEMNKEGYHERS